MKLTVLVDNNTYIDQYYLGEPAVCYYIEDGETRLLLDTGYSDVYIRNAKALGDRPGTGLCNRFVPWAQRPYSWIAILVRGNKYRCTYCCPSRCVQRKEMRGTFHRFPFVRILFKRELRTDFVKKAYEDKRPYYFSG